MKLDKTDRKLISYLYHHYREPLTKIAKACRISRDQVEYRLEKYEKQGLIRKYLTIFNYNLLGYNEFVIVWLKVSGNRETIKKELESMPNVVSTGDVISRYDLFVNFIFRDKMEFEKIFYSFIEKHKPKIQDYSVFITTYAEFFPLKTFGMFDEERTYNIVSQTQPIELDKKSMDILKKLEENGRARIVDVAQETGLSSELVLYKLRQLYKNKAVLGTRIQFDMEKLGFYFGSMIIKLKDRTEKTKEKIRDFCKSHKNINAVSFGISEHDCIIQAFYQEEAEFRQTLREIKEALRDEMKDSFILLIENEGRAKTLPF